MAELVFIVADDDVDSAQMLAVLLRVRLGARVVVVHDGGAAVSAALAEGPDAVILDFNMPVLSGEEAAAAIRASGLSPLPVLVALSGSTDLLANDSQQAAFDHTFSKPVDLPGLLAVLAR